MTAPISKEDWIEARRAAIDTMPQIVGEVGLPNVLLSYQAEAVKLLDSTAMVRVLVIEKSRRIGMTWGLAAYAVLRAGRVRAAGGMDGMYISYSMEMTREFVDACAMWARSFSTAALEAEEFLFADNDETGDRSIQAFRIRFASGFEIVALSSAPRSLRGKQGFVLIDEAAFVDNLEELLKAALAFLMWGGQVCVCSTHDGTENPFNTLVQDILSGKQKGEHLRIDFDEALQQGLYERIALVTGAPFDAETEAAWRQDIIDFYGSGADEELFCIPSAGTGAWLTRAMIVARMRDDIPVIRWKAPAGFVDWPEELRADEISDMCAEKLAPILQNLDPRSRSAIGVDFARSGDGSVYHPVQIARDLTRHTPFILELRDVPFESQKQILLYICRTLPRFFHAALDANGNGAYLAEVARQDIGVSAVSEIKPSESWYNFNMPPLKAAFEDGTIELPLDDDILGDYRLVKMVRGIARIPEGASTKGRDGFRRHGDAAIAGALALYASEQASGEIGADPVSAAVPDPATRDYYGAFGLPGEFPTIPEL